jgi:hypothetical protein
MPVSKKRKRAGKVVKRQAVELPVHVDLLSKYSATSSANFSVSFRGFPEGQIATSL